MPIFNKPTKIEKLWASNGDQTPPPDDSKIATGFIVEIPTLEQFNYIEYKQDAMLAHLNQRGIAEWDTNSSYYANISYVQGTNGIIYKAKQDSGPSVSSVNPVTEVGSVVWGIAFYTVSEVYTKTETNASYLAKSSNLADLSNIATARSNLAVYSIAESDTYFARRANNLSDVQNTTTSFNNIKQQATESYAGTARISTDSEANAGSDNTTMLTPRKLRLGFSINLSSTGYISFPTWLGGLIIQWGSNSVSGNSSVNASFARSFTTACLAGTASWTTFSTADQYAPRVTPSGATLNIYNTNGTADTVSWIAIGY